MQADFPLVQEPYRSLGRKLGLSHGETLERVRRLRESGLVRYISGIFNPEKLSYHRALVAAKVPPDNLPRAVAVLSDHPGVSHNYGREHTYNLWFTLNLPATEPLREGAEELAAAMGAEAMLFLPTLRVFKIGVYFDMEGEGRQGLKHSRTTLGRVKEKVALTDLEVEAVRRLQDNLPSESHPFAGAAASLGVSESELLAIARRFLARRIMRRFGAVLRHQQAGFTANTMGCWVVPQPRVEEVGKRMASFPSVSHCYERLTYPHWPYNLFTMIHGHTEEECQAVASEISRQTGIIDYSLLLTTEEYKRSRLRYFA